MKVTLIWRKIMQVWVYNCEGVRLTIGGHNMCSPSPFNFSKQYISPWTCLIFPVHPEAFWSKKELWWNGFRCGLARDFYNINEFSSCFGTRAKGFGIKRAHTCKKRKPSQWEGEPRYMGRGSQHKWKEKRTREKNDMPRDWSLGDKWDQECQPIERALDIKPSKFNY